MLAQGNAPGAKKEIEGNRVMALHSQNRLARFHFDLALAQVLSARTGPICPGSNWNGPGEKREIWVSRGSNSKPAWRSRN